jgi:hypothetical protein
MKQINFPKLTANDIQVRVSGKAGDNHRQYLLYQDSRVGMRLLDEIIGEMNYQVEYTSCAEQIYCCISIWDENKKQWIKKMDTGECSNISENKGIASDAFKRCCVKWGLGRELYTAPKIILPNEVSKFLKVSKIVYSGDVISVLELVDEKGNLVYTYPNNGSYTNIPTTTKQSSKEEIIQDVRNKANEIYPTIDNKEEFKKCVNYWIKKIEQNGYKGEFNLNQRWDNWQKRAS